MQKTNSKSHRSIVWAIDPYESKFAHRAPLAKAIKALSQALAEPVHPYSVVSPGILAWSGPLSMPAKSELRAGAEKSVRRDLAKLHMKNVETPEVQVRDSGSRRELVDAVLRFAKEKRAEIVAVNTRRLLSPLPRRVGGFAEALIAKSPLPVLAVSPKAKVSGRIKSILFPTDFCRASHRSFQKMLRVASRLDARLVLLNLEQPLELPFTPPEMAYGITEDYLMEAEKARHKSNRLCAQRWIAKAAKAGVSCTFVSEKGTVSIPEAILKASKRARADLICMTGKRNPGTPALMGGTVRDVLCEAKTPVLEIHQ